MRLWFFCLALLADAYFAGVAYLASMSYVTRNLMYGNGRGKNMLDGGAPFYQGAVLFELFFFFFVDDRRMVF